jgi:hypothetical protein
MAWFDKLPEIIDEVVKEAGEEARQPLEEEASAAKTEWKERQEALAEGADPFRLEEEVIAQLNFLAAEQQAAAARWEAQAQQTKADILKRREERRRSAEKVRQRRLNWRTRSRSNDLGLEAEQAVDRLYSKLRDFYVETEPTFRGAEDRSLNAIRSRRDVLHKDANRIARRRQELRFTAVLRFIFRLLVGFFIAVLAADWLLREGLGFQGGTLLAGSLVTWIAGEFVLNRWRERIERAFHRRWLRRRIFPNVAWDRVQTKIDALMDQAAERE